MKKNPMPKSALALIALTLLAAPVFADQHKDPASGCAVIAPRYLASSDYTFQYQGGCKGGLAEGKGKAIWTLSNAPEKKVTWEGAFSAGVYLPPPAGIVSAREWPGRNARDTVIFDLGALPAQSGIPAARLVVEAASDLTNYADPCAPRTAWVTNAPAQALAADSAAKALLTAATDKLRVRCGARLAEQKKGYGSPRLQVRAVSTPGLESDRWGNPGPVLVDAFMPLTPGDPIDRYNNQAAAQQRQQEQQAGNQQERQANAKRLRAFFKTHQAQGWAALVDIAQNPFRFAGRVVVTAGRLEGVINPASAVLYARDDDWRGAYAEINGEEVAQWKPGWRLLAVRVMGRESRSGGAVQLQLVGSQACDESRCQDWLNLPARLQDGEMP
jgi:hypothetical protein